ncbi:PREDICTED: uncharacterized protein LOC109236040 [Nicotiana attenuata]|uniref:uncharacterized protein LOC109236040 n=1 Tax=Nicotiana attenuata TaxID=49451 RepID=UPI00090574D0|nr:PREDICTED: uncharacterized protein LOC109236040 [Nicotiana attenuata]
MGTLTIITGGTTQTSLGVETKLEEVQSKKRKQVTFHEKLATIEAESEKSKESEKPTVEVVAKQPPPLIARPPPPFPQRLYKVKDNVAYKKFLDILKPVQINIPLVDTLQEVPKYAKYIKDIVANKRRLTEFEIVELIEECSSRIKIKLPQKLKDPGSFTIQILIDVLVQVGSFIFPADFVILDYDPDQQVPSLLGRPFLATGRAIIDLDRPVTLTPSKPSIEEAPKLELKPLPAHRRYAYLGNREISSDCLILLDRCARRKIAQSTSRA